MAVYIRQEYEFDLDDVLHDHQDVLNSLKKLFLTHEISEWAENKLEGDIYDDEDEVDREIIRMFRADIHDIAESIARYMRTSLSESAHKILDGIQEDEEGEFKMVPDNKDQMTFWPEETPMLIKVRIAA